MGKIAAVATVSSQTRLRLSSWHDPGRLQKNGAPNSAQIKSASGVLDDISMLSTIQNNATPAMDLKFEDGLFRFLNSDPIKPKTPTQVFDDKKALINKIIDECHQNGVQCLVGFEHAMVPEPKESTRFQNWLANQGSPSGSPSVAQFAQKIADFLDAHLTGADGLSLDLEWNGSDSVIPTMLNFYKEVATKLSPKIVAIATGRLTKNWRGSLVQDHIPYEDLASQGANILIRPMAYDFSPGNGTEPAILAWHDQILDHAIYDVSVPPTQFQLGIRTLPGGRGGEVTSQANVSARCSGTLRTHATGLCFFPASEGFWQASNNTLNPKPTPGSNTVGDPLQLPLSATLP